jgi:hypothetical protein
MLLFEINPQGARKMIQQNMSLEDGAAERERSFLKGALGKRLGGKGPKNSRGDYPQTPMYADSAFCPHRVLIGN